MAKRFSDTDKWKKSFFRGLEAPYKLLWMYVLDDCDIAGVWQVDFEVACIKIGEKVTERTALELFGDRVVQFDQGKKWFLSDFIFFQYGELSDTNNMHRAVTKILRSNNLDFPPTEKVKSGAPEGLTSPQGKGQGYGKGEGKGQGHKRETKIPNQVVMPFTSDRFKEVWNTWITYRHEIKKPYRSALSEQAALKNISKYSEETAIAMIEQSIAQTWQGIFEVKETTNGKSTITDKRTANLASIGEGIARRFNEANGTG